MVLDELSVPIVLAPLAGGPSTPQLAAAVCDAGGLGFLASGYLDADTLRQRIAEARGLTDGLLAANVFVPGRPTPAEDFADYVAEIATEARRSGADLGTPHFDDDDWQAKLDLLVADPLPVVSFTFGCPPPEIVSRLQRAGSEVWVTVTSVGEAVGAVGAGADVLVIQGAEAGGHRSTFVDDRRRDHIDGLSLMSLLQLVGHAVPVPLVASGGITTGAGVAAVLCAGAAAAQLGTAFLRCPEAGTSPVHRRWLDTQTPTAMTRAFTGRLARGIDNRFIGDHSPRAPVAYPEIHHLTAPLRQVGRSAGDGDLVNLWAGQTHALAQQMPAAQLVGSLAAEARAAVRGAARRTET